LANDYGAALSVGGYLSELRRTKIGDFLVEDAQTIDQFVKSVKEIEDNM
jgi:tRNA pseudouridine55 synthase